YGRIGGSPHHQYTNVESVVDAVVSVESDGKLAGHGATARPHDSTPDVEHLIDVRAERINPGATGTKRVQPENDFDGFQRLVPGRHGIGPGVPADGFGAGF